LAISFAVPTFAQEQITVDPDVHQQIEAVRTQYVEAFDKHDAAAIAALYTEDAVRVGDRIATTLLVGRDAIEKNFAEYFASDPPPLVGKIIEMYSLEDRIVAISDYDQGQFNGAQCGSLFS
jgi:uncharacterized protein (TIGR02246 family)